MQQPCIQLVDFCLIITNTKQDATLPAMKNNSHIRQLHQYIPLPSTDVLDTGYYQIVSDLIRPYTK